MKFLRWLLAPGCVQPMLIGLLWANDAISSRIVLALFVAFMVDHTWEYLVQRHQSGDPGHGS